MSLVSEASWTGLAFLMETEVLSVHFHFFLPFFSNQPPLAALQDSPHVSVHLKLPLYLFSLALSSLTSQLCLFFLLDTLLIESHVGSEHGLWSRTMKTQAPWPSQSDFTSLPWLPSLFSGEKQELPYPGLSVRIK